jgi:hypothetical protein
VFEAMELNGLQRDGGMNGCVAANFGDNTPTVCC